MPSFQIELSSMASSSGAEKGGEQPKKRLKTSPVPLSSSSLLELADKSGLNEAGVYFVSNFR